MDILIIPIVFYVISKIVEQNKNKKIDFNDLKKDISKVKEKEKIILKTDEIELNNKFSEKNNKKIDENYGEYKVLKEVEKKINSEKKQGINLDFSKKDELKRAVIFSEILGKPKALQKF